MCRRGFQKETNLFSKVKRAIYTNGTKMAYCTNIISYINTNANLVAWKKLYLKCEVNDTTAIFDHLNGYNDPRGEFYHDSHIHRGLPSTSWGDQ